MKAAQPMTPSAWLGLAARQIWCDRADIDRLLGRQWQQSLGSLITQAESGSAGEVRLCIEAALPGADILRARRLGPDRVIRERALGLFSQLRVWDTERNSGVLLYLLAFRVARRRGLLLQMGE